MGRIYAPRTSKVPRFCRGLYQTAVLRRTVTDERVRARGKRALLSHVRQVKDTETEIVMKPLGPILASALATALLAGAALADADHGHGRQAGPGPREAPGMGMTGIGTEGHGMMQMMMRMHGGMAGSGMMAGAGMGMGAPDGLAGMGMSPGMAMMPGLDGDADGDGAVTPDELRARLRDLFVEYDADANGSLSLEEFAALHAALMRETMVDRFQFLDDDGDGAVTATEIDKPARLMDRMRAAQRRMMAPDADAMPGPGGMMRGD